MYLVTTETILWGYYFLLPLYCIHFVKFCDQRQASPISKRNRIQWFHSLGYQEDVVDQLMFVQSSSTYIL